MRNVFLTAAASAAIGAASFLPIGSAEAMTPGTAAGVRAAAAETSLSESVACWRRHGRLVCRGGVYSRGYYGYPGYYASPYSGYPGYYGGYGPGVGVYGPGFGVGIGVGPRWGW